MDTSTAAKRPTPTGSSSSPAEPGLEQHRSLAGMIFRPHWRPNQPPWQEARMCCMDLCCKLTLVTLIAATVVFYMMYNQQLRYVQQARAAQHGEVSDVTDDAASGPARLAAVRTPADLAAFSGTDPGLPLALAVRGIVFDVSTGPGFYGVGASYNKLAGKPVSRAVALMSLEDSDLDRGDDLNGLDGMDIDGLNEIFEDVYVRKYPAVAFLEGSQAVPDDRQSAAQWFDTVRIKQRSLWAQHPAEAPEGYKADLRLRLRLSL